MTAIKILTTTCIFLLIIFSSCKKYFDVDIDSGQVVVEKVFGDDRSAASAIYGLYQTMVGGAFAAGGETGISFLTGLSGDELNNIQNAPEYILYENNELNADDPYILTLWTDAYRAIYQANDILESLETSLAITTGIRNQLKGEALFSRAYCYFYLVNLFGDVPLVISPDYRINMKISRASVDKVYEQIIIDLKEAESLLGIAYTEAERVRPNKYAANALLARTYLYRGEWENAKTQADSVLVQETYNLETDLNNVFVPGSQEVIWELASEQGFPAKDGSAFNLMWGLGYSSNEITANLLNAFESNDLRAQNWISFYHEDQSGIDFYYPYKYKVTYGVDGLEHFVVLRLAEQRLIRAEANAQLNLLDDAITDLDKVRVRAGLDPIAEINSGISKEDLLDLIFEERQRELFTELGHRWFDLKRSGRAMEVLPSVKPGLSVNDLLYPIPQAEFRKNPSLGNQNSGY